MSSRTGQPGVVFRILTPLAPGAVAIIELVGDIDASVVSILGRTDSLPIGALRLGRLADIDTALIVRVSESTLWLMPHGGPRIIQRLAHWLAGLGASPGSQPGRSPAFPEARSRIDALALEAVGRAASGLAIDLLLDQHRRWARHEEARESCETIDAILARSRLLNRLIVPPLVVVVGQPNVGKSTLTNALLGREASIASEVQGTTRDYVLSPLDLGGLVVRWCDTPGRHETADLTEREAMAISTELIDAADCLISASSPGIDWPRLSRPPDLRVRLKADLDPAHASLATGEAGESLVSAKTGRGLSDFVGRVRGFLLPPEALNHPGPWLFDDRVGQD